MQPFRFHFAAGRQEDEEQNQSLIEQDHRQPGQRDAEEAKPGLAVDDVGDMAKPRDEAAAHQSQEDHQADHPARSSLFLQDQGVQEREALKHPARRDQYDHELDEAAKIGDSHRQAEDHERQRAGKQQVLADGCPEEEAEHELGGRKGRDPVEIKNARGPRRSHRCSDLRAAHDGQDHGLKCEERTERAACREGVELISAPGDADAEHHGDDDGRDERLPPQAASESA